VGFETAVWRALAVFRGLGLLYAYAVYARRYDEYLHPVGGWVVLGVMTLWTVVVSVLYSRPAGRRWPVLWLDLAIAAAAVVLPRWLDDPSRIEAGAQTLPVVWAAAPVLAFAIRGSWPAGLGAAGVLAAADLVHRGSLTVPTANNIVLLALSGAVVGYAVDLGRRGEAALGRALAVSAAAAERERLSRDIHDGVLQVLALVGRRGRELGGEAAELGRLAAEQEQSLRALVGASAQEVAGEIDVRALLTSYASPVVTVSTPGDAGGARRGPGPRAGGGGGRRSGQRLMHAGEGARAWVLLEDEGSEVVVSVRDDGRGFGSARLAEARAEGRLGVASSIEGRVRDLGGTMTVESAPGAGTEIELRVPVEGQA
jgi:signal transduction histidine kinase